MAQPVLPQPHPVTGDTDQGCMRVNTRVTGTTIDIFNNMEGFNLCLSYCANTPGCFHWSWNTQGECRLVGEDGVEEVGEDYVSGNTMC